MCAPPLHKHLIQLALPSFSSALPLADSAPATRALLATGAEAAETEGAGAAGAAGAAGVARGAEAGVESARSRVGPDVTAGAGTA